MKTYLVGGAVRDKLLNIPVQDRDWVVVGATPEEMLARGFQQVGKDFPVFIHPDTGEEYALARTERKTARGHTGFAVHAAPDVTLEDDLRRRDLTINAIAEDEDGNLVDPYHGRDDLRDGLLRHVSPAFVEDPLRVLRVARFAARFAARGFRIAAETLALMREISASGELETLPAERIWQEVHGALGEPSPQVFFQVLDDCGALARVLPELHPQAADLAALERSVAMEQDAAQRFACLCSPLGESGVRRLCGELRTPNEFRDLAVLVARHHETCLRLDAGDADAAATVMTILERIDALRRPQRFEHFLGACRAIARSRGEDFPGETLLRESRTVASEIEPARVVDAGFKGAAIADELRRLRLERIAAALEEKKQ